MLTNITHLVNAVEYLFKKQSYPRPDGFRIRVVAGDVLKLVATHPTDDRRRQIDYSDYPISLAHTLLQVEKKKALICHESVHEIVGEVPGIASKVEFTRIKPSQFVQEGIARDDLRALWAFQILNKPSTI